MDVHLAFDGAVYFLLPWIIKRRRSLVWHEHVIHNICRLLPSSCEDFEQRVVEKKWIWGWWFGITFLSQGCCDNGRCWKHCFALYCIALYPCWFDRGGGWKTSTYRKHLLFHQHILTILILMQKKVHTGRKYSSVLDERLPFFHKYAANAHNIASMCFAQICFHFEYLSKICTRVTLFVPPLFFATFQVI